MAHRYTEEEIAALETEAQRKTGSRDLLSYSFVPSDCDEEDAIDVIARPFTRVEIAAYLSRPASPADAYNTALDVVLAIDGAMGGEVPAALTRLADMMDGALGRINDGACVTHGWVAPDEIAYAPLGRRTTETDATKLGLPGDVLALREKYTAAGELRMVRLGTLVSLVIRRPGRDAMGRLAKGKFFKEASDLAFDHIVFPASPESRRELFDRWAAIGYSLVTQFRQMREDGARAEGKGVPRAGGRLSG